MEDILSDVRTSIGSDPSTPAYAIASNDHPSGSGAEPLFFPHDDYAGEDHEHVYVHEDHRDVEEEVADAGGFEGDLEMGDDDGE